MALLSFNPNDPFEDTERCGGKDHTREECSVSTPTIRSRILKVLPARAIVAQIFVSFNPNDPFEDTERFTGFFHQVGDLAVSTPTIRSRILKVRV